MANVTCIGDIPHATPPLGTPTAPTPTLARPPRAGDTVPELSPGWGHSQNCHQAEDTVPELSLGSSHCHKTVTTLGTLTELSPTLSQELSPGSGHCPRTATRLGTCTELSPTLSQNCHRHHAGDTVPGLSLWWGHYPRAVTGLRTLSQNCHQAGDTVPELSPLWGTTRTCPQAQLPPPGWGHQTGNPWSGNNQDVSPAGTVTVTSGDCHQRSPPDQELSPRDRELLAPGVTPSWHRHGHCRGHWDTTGTPRGHWDTTGTPGHLGDTRMCPQSCHLSRDRTWVAPGGGVTVSPGDVATRCPPVPPLSPGATAVPAVPRCHSLSPGATAVPAVPSLHCPAPAAGTSLCTDPELGAPPGPPGPGVSPVSPRCPRGVPGVPGGLHYGGRARGGRGFGLYLIGGGAASGPPNKRV
ncbi:mucin-5B-like [Haemorhous mexicanus]|uniref:mucin-5B-like n=1 Tax=Haemorhous mexicanus TaxID=30427 RepID=UPI0028BE9C48|nr:mucin-5B-like [Haemorhous mexicanus]